MSDDESLNDSLSGSEDSDNEIISNKKLIAPKNTNTISQVFEESDESDNEESDNDVSDDEDDVDIIGGGDIDDDEEEGEIKEDDEDEENEENGDKEDGAEEDREENDENENNKNKNKKLSKKTSSKNDKTKKTSNLIITDYDDDDEDDGDEDDDENYLQKFDSEITKNYINDFHPECFSHNYDEIAKLAVVVRNSDNIIIDPNHKTIPFLTKYEKARVLGQRAKQVESGAKPLVKVPENIVDSHIIAELELREKKIPFIIRRPLPNGASEYWYIKDLEIIGF